MSKINKEREKLLTPSTLREFLRYDPATGDFTEGTPMYQLVSHVNNCNYKVIRINGHPYLAHRLAWLYVYGEFPNGDKPYIDHINGDKTDNRIENLRKASTSENNRNRAAYNKLGIKGVTKIRGKFVPKIWNPFIKKTEYLGTYLTEEEAKSVYEAKAREYHMEFYREAV